MAQQLTLDLDNNQTDGEFMLWYEDTKAEPEQAIKNAGRYYYQKYGVKPVRVVLPPNWKGNGGDPINTKPLINALDLDVTTSPLIESRHVAVYSKKETL